MRRFMLPALMGVLLLSPALRAEEMAKPDDHVTFDLAAEDWVTTKTARVTVNVEAAVNGTTTGTARADMLKAVNGLAAADWRLTSFNRSQDQTGLEHWSVSFESRLPETSLNGLNDNAKKASKAGMQLVIQNIDFSPTLDEMESARAGLRTEIYKKAMEQLASLNSTMTGRTYRIADINFSGNAVMPMMRAQAMTAMNMSNGADAASSDMERSEKLKLTAHVVLAAAPTATK